MTEQTKKIGIVGATGYTGEELLRVLARHSGVKVAFVTSEKEQGQPVQQVFPQLPAYRGLRFISASEATSQSVDLVFFCLPAGESAPLAQPFSENGVKIVDLGSDFRFYDAKVYEQWYGKKHPAPALLSETVYGLPEWNREQIRGARYVGNPGCYPTSILLALLPFYRQGILPDNTLVIDSKSGVSGAGKTPSRITHYVEVNESMKAYMPGRSHRHVGEIEQELSRFANQAVNILFTPHLVPMSRGIFSTIYMPLQQQVSKQDLLQILHAAYDQEPFVHILDAAIPSTAMAANTNNCFIGLNVVESANHVILFSAIDNLGKGASWQAVQNMNIMLDFDEEAGLI